MRALLMMVGLAACARGGSIASYVQSATIENNDLVITECSMSTQRETLVASGCSTRRQRLPVIFLPAEEAGPAEPMPLTAADVAEGIEPVRGDLAQCAADHGVLGVVRLKLAITPKGRVETVLPDNENVDYANCVEIAFVEARFLKTRTGAKLTFSIGAP